MTVAGLKAKANPTKAFFVRMLTRDISLEDCILDLVDNSVDGAWQSAGEIPSDLVVDTSLADYRIDITFDENGFEIVDNCGGISLDDAINYAFTFGRSDEQEPPDYTVGVYGIGMKRAVFKLGREITVESTYVDSGGAKASFLVPIHVDSWMGSNDRSWDFDIEENQIADEAGVRIRVRELTEETRSRFSDPTYARTLRRELGRDYMIPLMRGLRIFVNHREVSGWSLELRANDSFSPMREQYLDGDVQVQIIAGMASPPPDDREPDERKKEDISGWYIICNGRVVLAADTTAITGWGDALPKWHRQYSGFAGVVIFTAEDPELLPMTTTKRSVDVSSRVYQRAKARMQKPARAWIDYTNSRKQDIDAVKPLEEATVTMNVFAVPAAQELKLPTIARHRSREKLANVNYSVPLTRLRALALGLGSAQMSYRDVGLASFDFAYDEFAVEPE